MSTHIEWAHVTGFTATSFTSPEEIEDERGQVNDELALENEGVVVEGGLDDWIAFRDRLSHAIDEFSADTTNRS